MTGKHGACLISEAKGFSGLFGHLVVELFNVGHAEVSLTARERKLKGVVAHNTNLRIPCGERVASFVGLVKKQVSVDHVFTGKFKRVG